MSKKHKKHRHQNQGRANPVLNPGPAERSGVRGGKRSRKTGRILIAALVVIAAIVAYARNVAKSPRESHGAVAAANPPIPTPGVPPRPAPSTPLSGGRIASGSGPRIQFATPVHDFGRIKGGEVVKYTYVFTNAGQQVLEVTAVQASCGCTTAGDWSRQVEPGQTGSIPIEFNSGSFNGC